ncbi:alpha/beta fold hydrolase [Sphingomonas aerolata]|uniref:alpha/beta fold hydrolase n=1 Tax=Sphingomonas aerolata TaxID=185951 RepID=UPI002FDF5DBF
MPVITTPTLAIAYTDTGPREGDAVLLLHGWPDDSSTWDDVLPALHDAGLRTIVPSLRGFGETRFVAADTPRTGNSAVLAMDAIALMDGLGIARFMVAGHDWGSNIAEALAVGWPDRVQRIAMLATPPRLGGMPTPPFEQTQRQWYHWFMATARGAQAVRDDPRGLRMFTGPTGLRRAGSTRRPLREWRARSGIRTGSTSRCTAIARAGTKRRPIPRASGLRKR